MKLLKFFKKDKQAAETKEEEKKLTESDNSKLDKPGDDKTRIVVSNSFLLFYLKLD